MTDERAIIAARQSMVDDLVAQRIIRTPTIERAFRTVPRHAFLPQPFVLPTDPLLTEVVETDDIVPAWVAQLGADGRLVLPLCHVSVVAPTITSGVILTCSRPTRAFPESSSDRWSSSQCRAPLHPRATKGPSPRPYSAGLQSRNFCG